jgi:glycosyltransferase involved in cell wall biosynthesis
MVEKRIQIAFITAEDAHDRQSLSGSPYYVSKALEEYCGDVFYIDRLRPSKMSIIYLLRNLFSGFTVLYAYERLVQIFWKLRGKKYQWFRSPRISKFFARRIEKRLLERHYDLIFAENASCEIAYLKTEIPICYESDATFSSMVNYYPEYTNLTPSALANGNDLEQKALNRANLFICLSNWAANSAMYDYKVPSEKILILPRLACLDSTPERSSILLSKQNKCCRLLLVGKDWARKGCDIAVDTVNELNALGVPAVLSICGCLPPKGYDVGSHVELIGYLNKSNEQERMCLEQLFLGASFFLLPTRAECMGISFVEASAFGLPSIATKTGGVPSAVIDGETGFLLDIEAKGNQYASVIKAIWEDGEKYEQMRSNARDFYEGLSAEKWGSAVLEQLKILFRIEDT